MNVYIDRYMNVWEPGDWLPSSHQPRAYTMTPEHEKLFSLLCVIERLKGARRQNPDGVLLTLGKIHEHVGLALTDVGTHAKVSLRVRTACEGIVHFSTCTIAQTDPYWGLEKVFAAAEWGAGKSKLLTMVTDKTWREQCAGRATLALRRGDYPGLTFD